MARLLIGEDEVNIVESLRFVLERAGHAVRHADDGEAVLAAIAAERPDLLILDVMLPTLSGFDVLERLRADAALRRLPVLVLTAKGQARDREEADRLGADAFLAKPYANAELVEAVAALTAPR